MKKITFFCLLFTAVLAFVACGGNVKNTEPAEMSVEEELDKIFEETNTDENVINIESTTWELFSVDNFAEWQGEEFYYVAMNPLVFQSNGTILTQESNDYTYTYEQDGISINIFDELGITLEGYLSEDYLVFDAVYEGRDTNTVLVYKQNPENSSQELSEQEELPTEKPAVDGKTNVLDLIENVVEIDFSVPSIWRKEGAKDGFYYYPYEDNATLLYVSYSDTDNFPEYDITDRDKMSEIFAYVINGIEGSANSYNELSRVIKSFKDGNYYSILNYTCEINEKEYEILCCTFFTSTHSYSLTFGQPSNISKSFRETYGRILDSLQINQPTPTSAPTPIPTSSETTSQRNAVRMAEDYLDYMAFSRSGLIKQLEYEGFSKEDATYGVDNSGANWMEQAVRMAEDYLDYTAFSRSGLIKQLEYEGFTHEQAVYGVDEAGL